MESDSPSAGTLRVVLFGLFAVALAFAVAMPRSRTRTPPGEWTVETLRELMFEELADAEQRTQQRFDAQERAIAKAEAANEKRFDSVNEFRAQLRDQTATFLPRAEAEARFSALEGRIGKNEAAMSNITSVAEGRSTITGPLYAIGGAVVAGLIVFMITRRGGLRP